MFRLIIDVSGGNVQAVISSDPSIEVMVVDWDNIGRGAPIPVEYDCPTQIMSALEQEELLMKWRWQVHRDQILDAREKLDALLEDGGASNDAIRDAALALSNALRCGVIPIEAASTLVESEESDD